MKKKTLILVVTIALLALMVCGCGSTSLNADYAQVAQQLEGAGYTVTVVSDAEGLTAYGADGMTAAVIAYKGAEKLEEPDEEKLADYGMMELFYFETAEQAEAYYGTDAFQYGYQAWSDAYYHVGIRDFDYRYAGNIAYAGLKEALDLCK